MGLVRVENESGEGANESGEEEEEGGTMCEVRVTRHPDIVFLHLPFPLLVHFGIFLGDL